eukprot:GHVP01031631.1.p1 GENE.GHVP01031631.1~~GHVP01031631.1.p1  ORF type:complete len:108 (+),score=7.56 GHVP01031631.1:139-462(+)
MKLLLGRPCPCHRIVHSLCRYFLQPAISFETSFSSFSLYIWNQGYNFSFVDEPTIVEQLRDAEYQGFDPEVIISAIFYKTSMYYLSYQKTKGDIFFVRKTSTRCAEN